MGNEVENWIQVKATDKRHIDEIVNNLHKQGELDCYGYRDIVQHDNQFTARATTKWNPPIDEFKHWLDRFPDIELYALYKEEFLHFAGRIEGNLQEHVDFESVTSDDVRNATSGLLFELNEKLDLANHMDDDWRNDN